MKKQPVLHPFFFAAYAVLGVYSANYMEIPSEQVIRPLLAAILFAMAIYFSLHAWKKNFHVSGLLTTTLIFAFLYYGHAANYLRPFISLSAWTWVNLALFGLWALAFILFNTKRFWRLVGSEQSLTKYLNVTSVVVLILPVFIYARSIVLENSSPLFKAASQHAADLPATSPEIQPETLPDIYYIILDGYGGNDILAEVYGYDNSDFTDWLTKHGFYVAEKSRANYMHTLPSLGSSLNMEYLNYLYSEQPISASILREIIRDSRLEKTLRAYDYTIVSFTSETFFAKLNRDEVFLSPFSIMVNEFESYLLGNTVFGVLIQLLDLDIPQASYENQRAIVLYEFDQLPNLAAMDGPKFIFAHILAPHPPFIFDAEGNFTPPERPFASLDASDFDGTAEEYREGYIRQLRYINDKAKKAVEGILANSSRPTVIIIQGDHGPGLYTDFDKFSDACVGERFSILNAYYFPPKALKPEALEEVSPSISPVNTFRLMLNAYFGAQLALLPNHHYYTSNTAQLKFMELPSETVESCQIVK